MPVAFIAELASLLKAYEAMTLATIAINQTPVTIDLVLEYRVCVCV